MMFKSMILEDKIVACTIEFQVSFGKFGQKKLKTTKHGQELIPSVISYSW